MFDSKYNHNFLKKSFKPVNDQKYAPRFHIWPGSGLLNDPNCIFYYENFLYIMFQHYPLKPQHGLKSMSLAKTNNFYHFSYHYLVNKPDSKFDYDGVYSGNALIINNQVIMMYSGNTYTNDHSQRIMHVIKANYDLKTNKTFNKKSILTNLNFINKYTSHFRDPYIFVFSKENYMLLGAQSKFLKGKILLFKLDDKFENPCLVKEISFNDNNYMIECPNILFHQKKSYLIYCAQYNNVKTIKKQKLNQTFYSQIDVADLFNKRSKFLKLSHKNLVDYGPEFYAPQVFKINKNYYLIGWSGRSDSLQYKEAKNGWINTLTCIRKINFTNNELGFEAIKSWKHAIQKSKDSYVAYYQFKIKNHKKLIIKDNKKIVFQIQLIKDVIVIKRFNENKEYPCEELSKIKLNNFLDVTLEIFIDHSILEILINQTQWYTARVYMEKEINFYEL